MPAGIQIINTHGTVLIDDTSPCLQLKAKYTLSVRSGATAGIDHIDIPNVQSPLFALRPQQANRPVFVGSVSATGTPTTKRLQIRQTYGAGYDESGPVTVDIYHFDRPLPPTSSFGLQVFNQAGECIFDALGKTAVVVGSAVSTFPPVDVTPPGGRVYAFASPAPYRHYVMDYDSGIETDNHFANLGELLPGGAIRLRPATTVVYGQHSGSGPAVDIFYFGTPLMLAIDVTGY